MYAVEDVIRGMYIVSVEVFLSVAEPIKCHSFSLTYDGSDSIKKLTLAQ